MLSPSKHEVRLPWTQKPDRSPPRSCWRRDRRAGRRGCRARGCARAGSADSSGRPARPGPLDRADRAAAETAVLGRRPRRRDLARMHRLLDQEPGQHLGQPRRHAHRLAARHELHGRVRTGPALALALDEIVARLVHQRDRLVVGAIEVGDGGGAAGHAFGAVAPRSNRAAGTGARDPGIAAWNLRSGDLTIPF